jgi:hypothetical protein
MINIDVKTNLFVVYVMLLNVEQKEFGVGFDEEQMPEFRYTLTKINS